MRFFIAIELDLETRLILSDIQGILLYKGIKGNFTIPSNLHLTLKFLGEIDRSVFDKTSIMIKNIAGKHQSFVLTMDKIGKFDKGNRSIIWAGLKRNNVLESLYEEIDTELVKIMPIEKEKHYTPHITLARETIINRDVLNNCQLEEKLKHQFVTKGISLMESTRKDGKLVYIRRAFESFMA